MCEIMISALTTVLIFEFVCGRVVSQNNSSVRFRSSELCRFARERFVFPGHSACYVLERKLTDVYNRSPLHLSDVGVLASHLHLPLLIALVLCG